MAAPKKIDYERMEPDWRAGLLSPRQIAAKYTEATGQAVSHAAVIKHFTKENIQRDLGAKIKAKADAMVTEAMVTGSVTRKPSKPDKEIIEEGAVQVATIKLSHRKDIERARKLTNALMAELEAQTDPATLALLQELGVLLRTEDDNGNDRRNDLYQKVISLSERSKTMKTLADSLRIVVDLERQAFGMDKDVEKPQDGLTSLLQAITSGNASTFKPVTRDPAHDEDD